MRRPRTQAWGRGAPSGVSAAHEPTRVTRSASISKRRAHRPPQFAAQWFHMVRAPEGGALVGETLTAGMQVVGSLMECLAFGKLCEPLYGFADASLFRACCKHLESIVR